MKIMVTAGPTREAIDPVRYISNRSSGKMGYALAAAAAARGHAVVLVAGPTALPDPPGVRMLHVVTAAEMLTAVQSEFTAVDALIMAAAVADWRPAAPAARKIKKHAGRLKLELEPTADILTALKPGKGRRYVMGFAAETGNLPAAARVKLAAKGLDCIVANDVSRADIGFDVDYNQVLILTAGGGEERWPRLRKKTLAGRLIALLEQQVRPAPARGIRGKSRARHRRNDRDRRR